jgi:hypothetical protein
MTDDDSFLKKNPGICIICGAALQLNALEIPDAQKVIILTLEAYNQQRTIYKGPELWVCHKCAKQIAVNAADHAQRFNDAQ